MTCKRYLLSVLQEVLFYIMAKFEILGLLPRNELF